EVGVARESAGDGPPYWCVDFGLPRPQLDPASASAGVVEAVNRERAKADKPPLKANPKLQQAAQKLAEEMAERGALAQGETPPDERVKQGGYRFELLGESAAQGHPTPEDAVKPWLDSPSTRENFLREFTEIGVGY